MSRSMQKQKFCGRGLINRNRRNTMNTSEERVFKCAACGHTWSVAHGIARPSVCPSCQGENIHRLSPAGGFGGGQMGGGRCRNFRSGLNRSGHGHGQGAGRGGRGQGSLQCSGDHDHEGAHRQTGHGEGGQA